MVTLLSAVVEVVPLVPSHGHFFTSECVSPLVVFIATNTVGCVVNFHNHCGTAKQLIKEGEHGADDYTPLN